MEDRSYIRPDHIMDGCTNVLDVLVKRGYLAQCNDLEGLHDYLDTPGRRFYIGFDPTANSLHIGHFLQMMVIAHMQSAGHHPIALIGGGTAMIGDPTGRTDMRPIMTRETIDEHQSQFVDQLGLLVDFSEGHGESLNNADWLMKLNYLEFLREIGTHFSVNHMLSAECYKRRLEEGLTFLEFNYMLLQAYDFLHLFETCDCRIQFGGDDQWSNLLAGSDLIRRKHRANAYVTTFKLLTNADGTKMGKTANGALWLDAKKTSPFEFYQYWRNIEDVKVCETMSLLTFTPYEEIEEYQKLEGAELNPIKKLLAWRITALIHGREAADAAQKQAEELFEGQGRSALMPSHTLRRSDLSDTKLIDFCVDAKIFPSKGEGRRLIQQGGVYLNEMAIDSFDRCFEASDFESGEAILRRGKKKHYRIVIED
ncbi:MAG: tyrosine--tRNA ligase [Eubacteriales bacterium]|nr:tyrosine--tRNA ligase [Eubacteriales bacterium]